MKLTFSLQFIYLDGSKYLHVFTNPNIFRFWGGKISYLLTFPQLIQQRF